MGTFKQLLIRILKIVGIVLASFVVISGGAVGIAALTGAFEEEKIQITRIYFDDDITNTSKTVYTLGDIVEHIKYEPANATETTLNVTVVGNNNGVIEDIPEKLTAGKDFNIKVKKDTKGNNVGGVVTISAITSNGGADVTLRVIVDTQIPDNALYFTGSSFGKVDTTGKSFTLPISSKEQFVYLKSGLVNAFSLPVGAGENWKSAEIEYTYTTLSGKIEKQTVSNLQVDYALNSAEGRYNYFYKVPIIADEAGVITISAKMHRTHEIQEEFEAQGFGGLVQLIKDSKSSSATEVLKLQASTMLRKYNEFLNKYIEYFDTTQESYDFFRKHIPNGTISLGSDVEQVERSLQYVYVNCSATINVTAIKLKDFTTLKTPREYNVFGSTLYSISGTDCRNIIDDFAVDIETDDNDPGGSSEQLIEYARQNLVVNPYLYLDKDNIPDDNISLTGAGTKVQWAGRSYSAKPVYGFNGNSPIINISSSHMDIVGYLLLLEKTDEYISLTTELINNEKHWRLTCNTPLPNDQQQSGDIFKALYLGFEVAGISDEQSKNIQTFYSFSRVFVNYEDYKFVGNDVSNLSFTGVDENMTINTTLANSETLTKGLHQQDISLDITNKNISNIDNVSYTSIMYFVESESNKIDNGVKVATLGSYKFINFTNANKRDSSKTYYEFGEDVLIGERIPTYRTIKRDNSVYAKQYYLQALNASTEPVKLFAVAYLSDKYGNPIDINGRVVLIDEENVSADKIPELVVIRITSCENMPEVTVNSYIDEINFYTKALAEYSIGEDNSITFPEGFIKRNSINSYIKADDTYATESELKKIQDYLRLKFLKDNYFVLYLSPFDLDTNGEIVDFEAQLKDISAKSISGKDITISYPINVMSNKQIAFNNICKDFNNYSLYTGGEGTGVSIVSKYTFNKGDGEYDSTAEDDAKMIQFVIHATSVNNNIQTNLIYLDPTGSSIPYSPLLTPSSTQTNISKNNWVIFETNKIVINNIELGDDVGTYTKLYARYAEDNSNGELSFRTQAITNGAMSRTNYTLSLVDGNIPYFAETNLIDGNNQYNLEMVDCSQAGNIDIPKDAEGYYYANIEEYIDHYISGDNGKNITYTNPDNMIFFAETYAFNNAESGEYYSDRIFFGKKSFYFANADDYVDINGYKLPLTRVDGSEEIQVIIEQGTYFPKIGDKVLIYDELFQIHREDNQEFIIDYESSVDSGTNISIKNGAELVLASEEIKAYNPDTYVDDSSTESKKSAITVVDNDTATVNFIQGEELGSYQEDISGEYMKVVDSDNENKVSFVRITDPEYTGTRYSIKGSFVRDDNGQYMKVYSYERVNSSTYSGDRYKLVGNNYVQDDEGQYMKVASYQIITDPEFDGERYAKKGVVVYIVVCFNLIKTGDGGSEYQFYRTLTYELIQEEIEIIGVNKTEAGVQDINTNGNKLSVEAGKSTIIYLGISSDASKAVITTKASEEAYFFNHVSFAISSTSVVGINLTEVKSDNKKTAITLSVPDLISEESFTISMTYKYKGKTVTRYFYVRVEPNIIFTPKTISAEALTWRGDSYSVYKISLTGGDIPYRIFANGTSSGAIINTYFNIDEKISNVSLSVVGNLANAIGSISLEGMLYIDKSLINNNNGINRDRELFTITLTISGNAQRVITVTTKLLIEVVPEYIVDMSLLNTENTNGVTIFNGDKLFVEYIKLYEGNETSLDDNKLIQTTATYQGVFQITSNNNGVEIGEDGSIKLKDIPKVDTEIELTASYGYYNGENFVSCGSKPFKITILGVVLYYKGTTTSDIRELGNKDIEVLLTSVDSLDLDNYFDFKLSSESVTNINIQAVLVDENNVIVENSSAVAGKKYSIGYARATGGGGFELIETTGCTFKYTTE